MTISKIINKKDKWLSIEEGEASKKGFKHRKVKFSLLEEAMSFWIEQMTAKGVIFTEVLIKEKVELFGKLLEIPKEELSFSNGWIFIVMTCVPTDCTVKQVQLQYRYCKMNVRSFKKFSS